jgi:nucleoside-diphosphate-sugar epimerase
MVIHCAAYGVDYRQQDYQVAIQTNVAGTALLVEAAARVWVERFIHVGTCYEYGDYPYPVSEDTCLRPRSAYGATKAAGTLVALERAAALGLPLVVVRPFTMYGPFEGEHKLVPQIVTACRKREPLNLTAGEQVRDFVFVEDIVEDCLRLAEVADFPAGEILNLGTGQAMTIHSFGKAIAEVMGQDVALLRWGLRPYRQDEIMHIVADRTKAINILRWATNTSHADGIQKTVTTLESAKAGTRA